MSEGPERRACTSRRGFIAATLALAVLGAVAAAIYAAFQFTQGGCGLVRFYDRLLGALVIVPWFVATALALWLAWLGRRGRTRLLATGFLLALSSCAFMTIVGGLSVRTLIEADYSYKSPDRLLQLLADGSADEKKMAAYEVGNRKLPEAVPQLVLYLADEGADINLRLNAARALDRIGGEEADAALERAFASCSEREFCDALQFTVPRDGPRPTRDSGDK